MTLKETPTTRIEEESQPQGKGGLSRRDLLKGGIAASIAALLSRPKEVHAEEPPKPKAEKHEEKLSPALDYSTAGAVLASFAYRVLYGSAVKGIDLNWKSALHLNLVAQARIAALKYFGGPEGEHVAHEDQHEIIEGLKPVPILVGLSDATTTELQVESNEIFKQVENGTKVTSYGNIKRPSLGEDIKEWNAHLESVNKDLVLKASQISAVTSVLAPIGTTYTSSSLANNMKKEILRMLYEQSYAMEVIAQRQKMQEYDKNVKEEYPYLTHEEIHLKASKRAHKLFNGNKGFSKLMLTLAANTQGSWGIGDPPEIYYFKNHYKHPKRLAKAHAIGAVNSEILSILTTLWWLREVKVPLRGAFHEFTKGQITTIKALLELIANGKVRSVSLNKGKKFVKEMEQTLETNENGEAFELLEILKSIPKAKLQFSLSDYLKNKLKVLQKIADKKRGTKPEFASDMALGSADRFADHPIVDDLRRLLIDNQGKGKQSLQRNLATIGERIQALKSERLEGLFSGMVEHMDVTPELVQDLAEKEENEEPLNKDDERMKQRAEHVLSLHGAIMEEMGGYKKIKVGDRLSQAKSLLKEIDAERLTPEYKEQTYQQGAKIHDVLQSPERKTLADAIALFSKVAPSEKDAIEGMEKVATPGQRIEDIQHQTSTEHKLSLLSHSAKEVGWALLTQIPAVPSAARVAEHAIPAAAGVENGEKPTLGQLKNIIALTLTLEAALSATADNVAAYLFGEKVLLAFFKNTFGEEALKRNPDVVDAITIAALKVAENAGNLTKVGNGPNFSQEEMTIVEDGVFAQGISIDVSSMKMGDTLPHKNHFASGVNGLSIGAFTYHLCQIAEDLEEKITHKAAKQQ